ncbi:MAG: hypothetical protein HY814_05585 [Candidatus Riflebacteria bacterium]|nr:hypothetical protein [Candidatus Riflebacteria bacterium]
MLLLWLALIGAPPAMACDPVLLTLLRGKSRQTQFDRSVESISTRLNDVAARARLAQWELGARQLAQVERDWVGLYGKFYLSRNTDAPRSEDWQVTFDAVSKQLGQVAGFYAKRDFEGLHPVVKEIQERLIRFYEARTADTPLARFDRARAAAQAFVKAAAASRSTTSDLGEAYLNLQKHVSALPVEASTTRDELFRRMRDCGQMFQSGERQVRPAAPEIEKVLERYRRETLAKLWFAPPPAVSGGKSSKP